MKTPWSERPWHRVLVYGLGLSGCAAARFLRRRDVAVLGVDDRSPDTLDLAEWAGDGGFVAYEAGALAELPPDVDGVVVSPGVPPERRLVAAARRRGLPVIGEIELAFPFVSGPVLAITGSNGKSTTTALAGAMLEAAGLQVAVCGNIGRPLADCLDEEVDAYVAELSSYQLESTVTFHPRVAALLNLSPDHLDRHGDLESYGAAKAAIFANQGAGDTAVLNADDPLVMRLGQGETVGDGTRRRYFSRQAEVADGCYVEDGVVVEVAPGEARRRLFASTDVPVPGTHNLENAMAAALLARALGVEPEALSAGLSAFTGLPHRVERVRELGGTLWYDDSKGTNVGATLKSLEGFADGTVHLILGGRAKGSDLRELAEVVATKVVRLYLIGESAAEFERALGELAPVERSGDLEHAVAAAARHAVSGEVVLLSPACASFDQYDNFMRRGEHFQVLVRDLPDETTGTDERAENG